MSGGAGNFRMPDVLKLRLEKQGRGGKSVTVIEGFQVDPLTLEGLLSVLKKDLGTGGTRKGRNLELQGDQRLKLRPKLAGMGHRVKG